MSPIKSEKVQSRLMLSITSKNYSFLMYAPLNCTFFSSYLYVSRAFPYYFPGCILSFILTLFRNNERINATPEITVATINV